MPEVRSLHVVTVIHRSSSNGGATAAVTRRWFDAAHLGKTEPLARPDPALTDCVE